MTRYLPIAFGVLIIVALTYVQFRMTDRLSAPSVTAAQRAELLKKIPMNIGDWHGEDIPIDPRIRQTAGATGAVQRKYRNVRTNEEVDLWLIVGHGRSVTRHTPKVCYQSSGFTARSDENSLYPMIQEDGTEVPFFTNAFFREDASGRRLIRVFWTWYNSAKAKPGDKVVWETPSNPPWYFGNTRALFKMYFTSAMRDPMETADKSPCMNFAREFLPVVDSALAQVSDPNAKPAPKAEDAGGEDAKPEADAKAEQETQPAADADAPAPSAEESAETPVPAPAAEVTPSVDPIELLGTDPAAAPTAKPEETPSPK